MKQDNRTCTTEGCEKPLRARGMCVQHYNEARNAGLPTVRKYSGRKQTLRGSLIARLWAKTTVVPPPDHVPEIGDCQLWQGCRTRKGYGRIGLGGAAAGTGTVHVASWELHFPDQPRNGLNVCHRCDRRNCWAKDHLFLGTQDQNLQDMRAKDRHVYGERSPHAVINEAMVRAIRADWDTGQYKTRDIMNRHGVNKAIAYQVTRRVTWKHLN